MPRKRSAASAARLPLAYALGTPAKVAALRALTGAGDPVTQRDVARRAGVLHRSIQLALDDLVQLGIVTRLAGGRDFLVRLNDAHRMAASLRQLFDAEAAHFLELRQRLAEVAGALGRRNGLVCVAIFGSVARATDTPTSDCDVVIVARDESACARAVDAFHAAAPALLGSLGSRLAPVGYVLADARRRWRRNAAPFDTLRRDAMVVFGPPLAAALSDTP